MTYSTEEKKSLIKKGKITASKNIKGFLNAVRKKNGSVNAILHVNENAVAEAEAADRKIKAGKAGRLAGLAIVVKSNISVTGLPVTCASKTLENYYGTFDADVIAKIKAEDGIIIGMANMDEFACGSSGETSAFGATHNPAAPGRIPGGTSSGSAAAVAAGFCDLALGSDTGGSIRNPASHCGVVGIKPSYGRVSRYGLVDMTMSFDQIGPLSNDAYGAALLMEVIAGKSENDGTTQFRDERNVQSGNARFATANKVPDYLKLLQNGVKGIKIGMSPEFEEMCSDKRIYGLIEDAAHKFAAATKSTIKQIKLPYVDMAIQAYYPIVYVEFFSGTRKFDGRKYGKKIEDSCGEEVLRRILGGREISKAEHHGTYYRKALMAKKRIAEGFESAFKDVDIIISPTTPMLPHRIGTKISDPMVMYAYDAYTIPVNLAGVCAGVVPAGKIDGIPVGLQTMTPAFREELLLQTLAGIEKQSL
ncbi:Asp-tRNA(Asn)/Glu-tRNA(Gln) amidotransferase subunit GatA [Candidatus Woesearchaeota archaeon]|nr:Asp-tRNA(Asn)/Glu-tRNA(Gln) amidotransferase subunit GatA [Candidatus Woesearchaeota archaeon]